MKTSRAEQSVYLWPPLRLLALAALIGVSCLAALLALLYLPASAQQILASQSKPGSFPIRSPFGSGTDHTIALGVGDMDGDGDLDIVAGNTDEPSYIALNDGHGSFPREQLQFIGAAVGATSLAIGDLDGDGDLDVVIGYNDGSAIRYLNDGFGQLSQPETFAPATGSGNRTSVALGDINGDGYFDVVLTREKSTAMVFYNDGPGDPARFTITRTLGSDSNQAETVALGHLDDNDQLDVVVAPGTGPVTIFYQDDRNFVITRTLGAIDQQVRDIALGDFNGDGKLDVLTTLAETKTKPPHILYANNGNREFKEPSAFGEVTRRIQVWSTAVGDLTGDGILDLAVGMDDQGSSSNLSRVFLNPVASKDEHYIFGPPGQKTSAIALADVNDDGFLDIITGNEGFENIVYLNGEALATSDTTLDTKPFAKLVAVALGDIDRDGMLDIVTGIESEEPHGTSTKAVLLNQGESSFKVQLFGLDSESTWALALADVDRDGALDIVASNPEGDTRAVYINDGAGYFPLDLRQSIPFTHQRPHIPANVNQGSSVATGDLDSAKGIDLVMCSSLYGCSIYLNDGDGYFLIERALGDPADPSTAVAIADINTDGRLDIVVGNKADWNYVYFNDGSGGFPMSLRRPFGSGSDFTWAVAVADVNGDSKPDVLAGNFFESGAIYLNDGYGNFPNRLARQFGNGTDRTYSIATGDVNGDGFVDFVTGNWATDDTNKALENVLYLNDGSGGFVSTVLPKANWTRGIALGDMDGNGTLDIVEANRYGNQPLLLRTNRLRNSEFEPNGMPTIVMAQPVATRNALMMSATQVHDADLITLTFTLRDPESDFVGRVAVDYSSDGGGHWMPARILVSDTIKHLATSPAGVSHQITWDMASSEVFGRTDNMVLRVRAYSQPDAAGANPDTYLYIDSVPSLNQWPYATATTLPFNVQGAGVVVVSDTLPLTDTLVYRLPVGQERGAEPLGGPAGPYRTDAQGFLRGRAAIRAGETVTDSDQLVAIWPSALVASTTPTRFYANSESFTATNGSPLVSHLVISDARRIATINTWVDISATLPVSVELNLISPNGDRIMLLRDFLPAGELLCTGEDFNHLPCGAAARRIFTPTLIAPRNPLAEGTWTLEASTFMTEPLELIGWGLALKLSPLNFTSAEPITTGLHTDPVAGGLQTLTVSTENPLLLFDLDVALEWDASNDEHYQTQLSADLRRASELLYDWTNGQVALGNVRVYHDARRNELPDGKNAWNNAHIRVYASNRLRPNADQGGLISQPFSETVTVTPYPFNALFALFSSQPVTKVITYLPGQVRMGATWNRYGDATVGNLGDDWPAALAHELGHYLLFLDDNYLTLEDNNLIVPLSDDECPGAMNNPYSNAYSEFHPEQGWGTSGCQKTMSKLNTSRSDWETIEQFYPWLFAPTGNFTETEMGPSLLPLAVTQIIFQSPNPASDPMTWLAQRYGQPGEAPQMVYQRHCRPKGEARRAPDIVNLPGESPESPTFECPVGVITSTQPLEVPIFYLKGTSQESTFEQARAFLFQGPPYPSLVDLGQPIGDQVVAIGARPNDRLCVYDLAAGRVGCEIVTPGDDQLEVQQPLGWYPQIRVSPSATSRDLQVSVELPDVRENQELTLAARLYPMDSPAPVSTTMALVGCTEGNCVYSATLSFDTPVLEGYILVGEDKGKGVGVNSRQAVTEFAIGGNPVRIRGLRASTDPRSVRVRGLRVRIRGLRAPAASVDGQVMVYPDPDKKVFDPEKEWSFTLQPATRLPDELPWATPVDRAYWLSASSNITDFGKSSITFEYLRSDVPPGEESFIRMYFWEQDDFAKCPFVTGPCWRLLGEQESHPEHNLISARLEGPGLYALFSHYEIPLQPGWNLIGYPVQTNSVLTANRGIDDILKSIEGQYSAVYGYYPCDTHDPVKVHGPGVPPWVNDLETPDFGHGYWINVTSTEPITLYLRGSLEGTETYTEPTCPGAQTGGALRPPPTTYYGTVTGDEGFSPSAGLHVEALIDGVVCGDGVTLAGEDGIHYTVAVEVASVENGMRCGAHGRQVEFAVDGISRGQPVVWSDVGLKAHDLTSTASDDSENPDVACTNLLELLFFKARCAETSSAPTK